MNHLDSLLTRPFNRRSFLKTAGAGSIALVFGGTLLPTGAGAVSTDTRIVNTEGARLRSGPGTGYTILASLAKGTEVQYLAYGGSANGYEWHKVKVLASGKEGFIASVLLSMPGSTGSDPVIIGTAKTLTNVNLRSGPSTSHQVLRVVPYGASIQVSSTVQGGFRYVIHNGLAGWMSDQYIAWGSQPGTTTFTTTANLNLRAEPSTSAKVLLVMPSGAKVTALAGTASGWRQVSYNGVTGWASTAYLN
jgi:mannosyl-glycoprotein endo-beta-N-acetylglucosaminidase